MLSIELPWFSLQLDFLQHLLFLYVSIIKIDTKHFFYTVPCCIAWQWALNPLNKQNYTQHAHTWRLNCWFIETRKYFPTLAGLLPQSSSCQDHPGHWVYVIYTIVIFWFKIMENLCLSSRAGANLHSVHSRSVRWKEEWQRQRNSKRKSGVLSVVLKIWNVWHQLCLFYHLTRSRCEGEVGGINVKREETAFSKKIRFRKKLK